MTDTIDIIWTSDVHKCDTCEGTYAEGAAVFLNEVSILHLVPKARCCRTDGDSWPKNAVYAILLERLGYEVNYG